jgi:hypothetical protein
MIRVGLLKPMLGDGAAEVSITIDIEGARWLADEMESVYLNSRDRAARDLADGIYEILGGSDGDDG